MAKASRSNLSKRDDGRESGVVMKARDTVDSWPEVTELSPPSVDGSRDEAVTLLVYVWRNAHPGVMSWVFPSARAALIAARTMRNAVRWMIVSGDTTKTIAEARRGPILFEETAFST